MCYISKPYWGLKYVMAAWSLEGEGVNPDPNSFSSKRLFLVYARVRKVINEKCS